MFNRINLTTEVVSGMCPTCDQESVMISIVTDRYRCINCGENLQQRVNGVISYLPIGSSTLSSKPNLKNGS
jgi:transposase-like protein